MIILHVSCNAQLTNDDILLQDQLEADEDLSLKQRLALAGGSAVEGVGDVTGVDAVNIAGKESN